VNRVEVQKRLKELQAQLQGFETGDLECGNGQDTLAIVVLGLLDLYLATAFYSPSAALGGLDRVMAWLESEATKGLTGGDNG